MMRGARTNLAAVAAVAALVVACSSRSADDPIGAVVVPVEARAVDTSNPTHVIGTGTPASCTSDAVVATIAMGGLITFDCGPDAITIFLRQTAKIVNDTGPDIVIDGGGKVTLSGGGEHRILYQNTCDPGQQWTTSRCDDQEVPRLTVQNLTFVDGNATGEPADSAGGGAIFARGGRLKIVNSTFRRNHCDSTGPDVGGGAVRALDQYQDQPVYVVGSTFGGSANQGNTCSNGGALSSIGVSWQVLNSVLSFNRATGEGANPPQPGTPGGGNGGAIYLDGNEMTLRVAGSVIEDNAANEGGGAIFFVSNNRTGTMQIDTSIVRRNTSGQFETPGYPGIFFLGAGTPTVTGSPVTEPTAPPAPSGPPRTEPGPPASSGPSRTTRPRRTTTRPTTPPAGPTTRSPSGPPTTRRPGAAEPVVATPIYSG
jgi:hypothetical protein